MNLRRYFFTLLVVLPLSSPLSAQETEEDDKFYLDFAGSAVFPYNPKGQLGHGAYLRRRALGQRVRMAAELRLGEGRLDKPPPGRMPALLTARNPGNPRPCTPVPVQSRG